MPKLCNHEGCKYKQFGGGFCRYHQRDRTDKKVSPRNKSTVASWKLRTARQKPIRNVSRKGKIRQQQKAKLIEKDRLLWAAIWEERPHIDFETNEPIYGEPLTLYFHHILERRNYPQYRYSKWNIVLVSWDTHAKAESDLDLVPKIKAYRNKLLKTKAK